MMFILRAIFWLAVVSAILPPRGPDEAGIGESAGRMVGAAMDYCAARPGLCIDGAVASAQTVRIPAELIAQAHGFVAAVPAEAVPLPLPRPAEIGRKG